MDSFHARPSLVPSTFMRYGTNATRLHGRDSHWNLEALGIVPEAQGRVLGTRLLVHGLARADQDGLHCYLTSQPITRAPVSPALLKAGLSRRLLTRQPWRPLGG